MSAILLDKLSRSAGILESSLLRIALSEGKPALLPPDIISTAMCLLWWEPRWCCSDDPTELFSPAHFAHSHRQNAVLTNETALLSSRPPR